MVDCLLVVLFFFSDRVVPLPLGKVRKGDVLRRVKVHFAWQVWDFVALKRKLLCGALIVSSPLSMWKVRKGDGSPLEFPL